MFRFLTAGESHGRALSLIIEGLPAGVPLTGKQINQDLARRQRGYGRGGRMLIEKDRVQITAGLRQGQTLGSPLAMTIQNQDWVNWQEIMDPEKNVLAKEHIIKRPRPGHADLAGALKYDRYDFRDILERASARETAARVAVGAVAKALLACFEVEIGSWISQVGPVRMNKPPGNPKQLFQGAEKSDMRCPAAQAAQSMRKAIDQARQAGDTLGGIFTVAAWGLIPGLGSYVQWDRRLDMRIAGALMSIPAVKGVEFGIGFQAAGLPGSSVQDVITYRSGAASGGFGRKTNHAGGVEGGMSTGQPILVHAAMKPIATLRKPLMSIEMPTKQRRAAGYERSDVCAVPAAAVVGEAMVAVELVSAWLEKFGGDSLSEIQRNWKAYQRYLEKR